MKLTRRFFSGIAAVAPAALAKAPTGLALGSAVRGAVGGLGDAQCGEVTPTNPLADAVWKQIFRRRDQQGATRTAATREAAGILDPEIQALTACSPVYRMHLQQQKDERAESIIQKLRDRIEQLEKLG